MPEKVDKMRLSEEQDRRRKLTEEQKESIRTEYALGNTSHAKLADKYGVSKSLVTLILNPERAARVKQRVADHWREYHDPDKHREATKATRHYKKELVRKQELGMKEESE